MNKLQTELGFIKSKFPQKNDRIEELYNSDLDFKSLCADLFLCSLLIETFKTEIKEKKRSLIEYSNVVRELENDLIITLEAGKTV